ncbi:MAG TPA: aminopeptidase [Longimicrobium sp.]|nr:aminopeptidase [Longimicrobium sp.]
MLALPLLVGALGACSPGYVLRGAWEEGKILARRRPIVQVIADRRTTPETRRKLELVLTARDFARDSLGLRTGESYTLYSEKKSDTLATVLSAAYKDQFRAKTWWFPIVGSVPYKGFFQEEDARREAAKLEAQGFDTYMRPTSAFSTLGWFNDPVLSTLLRYDSVSLGNTVIHELVHNTYFAPGKISFNESLANFVGGRGAIALFCGRDGPDAPTCTRARQEWDDDLVFGFFMGELIHDLESLYARTDITREQKLALRDEVFARAQRQFEQEVRPRLKATSFSSFVRDPLNNATLISRRLYYDRLDLFERVYDRRGGDLRGTIAAIIAAARANKSDPFAGVEGLLR